MSIHRMTNQGARRYMSTRQAGFSFFEVLIAMLVLGVAVLGFAGLQVRALDSTGDAHQRAQAMTLAAEMVERIRGNRTALATYTTAATWTSTLPANDPGSWTGTNACLKAAVADNGCTATAMATFDALEVRYLAAQLLPAGEVQVRNTDCAGAGTFVTCVFVAWNGTDPATCDTNADANCVAMRVVAQ